MLKEKFKEKIRAVVTDASKGMMDFLQKEFENYEIQCIVADLELNLPLPHCKEPAKGSLKVVMRKKKE